MKNAKSKERRMEEATTLKDKFLGLGFPLDDESVRKVLHVLQQFADEGIGSSGEIPLEPWGVIARYKLSLQQHIVSELTVGKVQEAQRNGRRATNKKKTDS